MTILTIVAIVIGSAIISTVASIAFITLVLKAQGFTNV